MLIFLYHFSVQVDGKPFQESRRARIPDIVALSNDAFIQTDIQTDNQSVGTRILQLGKKCFDINHMASEPAMHHQEYNMVSNILVASLSALQNGGHLGVSRVDQHP